MGSRREIFVEPLFQPAPGIRNGFLQEIGSDLNTHTDYNGGCNHVMFGEERKLGEYEVKAVFVYNLAKFIEWPDKSMDNSTTLTLYILGEDPFGVRSGFNQGQVDQRENGCCQTDRFSR